MDALIARVDELRDLDATDFTCSLRPVRALPLLQEVARFTRALPGRHHVRVLGDDVRISADPVRLGQALWRGERIDDDESARLAREALLADSVVGVTSALLPTRGTRTRSRRPPSSTPCCSPAPT